MQSRVLVVEDDYTLREAVTEVLKHEGFETEEAGDGWEALRLLEDDARRPDVILLDLMMPVMNGWEFRDAQLAAPKLASIPVVVVSAQDPDGIRADALFAKPYDIDPLVNVLRRFAGGHA